MIASNTKWHRAVMSLLIVGAVAGCASTGSRSEPVAATGSFPGLIAGYLSPKEIPNSLSFLPPPPAKGSAALALDEEISKKSFALRDTPRWTLAISDADLSFPHAASTYSCALNAPVSEVDTPRLYALLHRTLADAASSTVTTKNYYNRTRPFALNKQPLCTPADQARLAHEGSYPSGHTTIGWSWALILAEISPEQADAILARGLTFGESRNVCNAHWHSDVVQARSMAAAGVARLHANPAFLADLNAAKAELTAVRSRGLKPSRDCSAEAAALAIQPSLAQ